MVRIQKRTIQRIFRRVVKTWLPNSEVRLRFVPEFFECLFQSRTHTEMKKQLSKVRASYYKGVISVYSPALSYAKWRFRTLSIHEVWEAALIHELCHHVVGNSRLPHPRRFARLYTSILRLRFSPQQIREMLRWEMWSGQHGDYVRAGVVCQKWGLTR